MLTALMSPKFNCQPTKKRQKPSAKCICDQREGISEPVWPTIGDFDREFVQLRTYVEIAVYLIVRSLLGHFSPLRWSMVVRIRYATAGLYIIITIILRTLSFCCVRPWRMGLFERCHAKHCDSADSGTFRPSTSRSKNFAEMRAPHIGYASCLTEMR